MSGAEILGLNCDDLCEFLTDEGVHPYAVEKIKGKFLFCNMVRSVDLCGHTLGLHSIHIRLKGEKKDFSCLDVALVNNSIILLTNINIFIRFPVSLKI